MSHLNPLFFFALILALSVGCRKDRSLASWDADVLAPIATGTIDFSNYLPADYTYVDNANLLHLVASETLISLGLDTLIGIPDYTIDTGFVVPISLNFPPGVPFFIEEEVTKFDLKDVELTYAIIRESEITVKLKNTIDKPVLFQYGIYSATFEGDTFFVEERVEANSTLNKAYDLNGYELDFRGADGTSFNTVITFIQAMIHPDETAVHTFKAGDRFDIANTVTNIIPEYVTGYFGNQSVVFQEDQALDVFNQFNFTSANITDFDIVMTIDNGIGADLKLGVERLATSSESNSEVDLDHKLIGSTELFSRAINLYEPENPVKHLSKTFQFTDENSNLDELLEIRPNRFLADLEIEVNPLGNISLGNDFAYYGHNLNAHLDLDVPIVASLKGVTLVDTVDVDFSIENADDEIDRLNSGQLKIMLLNGYPLEARVQFYLMDTLGATVDSLLNEATLIEGALENANGQVEEQAKSVIFVPIDQERIDALEMSNRIRIDAELNTTGLDTIHLKSTGRLDFRIVADLNVKAQ